jgi:hypothetical protein
MRLIRGSENRNGARNHWNSRKKAQRTQKKDSKEGEVCDVEFTTASQARQRSTALISLGLHVSLVLFFAFFALFRGYSNYRILNRIR